MLSSLNRSSGLCLFVVTVVACTLVVHFTIAPRLKASGIQVMKADITNRQISPPAGNLVPKTKEQAELFNIRAKGLDHGLSTADVDMMTEEEKNITRQIALDNIDTICRRKIRMGKLGDGGWEVCDDKDVRPPPTCLVYSFGINNDFSFDDDTAKIFGCDVIAFDPSMRQASHKRSARVHFYNVGIAGKTEKLAGQKDKRKNGWQVYTFKDLQQFLHHEGRTVDVIKMDVEMAEWSVLSDMLASGAFKGVKQFFVEYHVFPSDVTKTLKILQSLERIGFKKFYVHKNFHCPLKEPGIPVLRTGCWEVHYVYRP